MSKSWSSYLDFYSSVPSISINKSRRSIICIGLILSMLSLLGMLFFSIYYLFTYFYCNSINVVYSKEISIDVIPLMTQI